MGSSGDGGSSTERSSLAPCTCRSRVFDWRAQSVSTIALGQTPSSAANVRETDEGVAEVADTALHEVSPAERKGRASCGPGRLDFNPAG